MEKITKEEILKIAFFSRIKIKEKEIESLVTYVQDVLSYAKCVKDVAADVQEPSDKNINIMREDLIVKTNPEPLLHQAPEHQENYFVVPMMKANGITTRATPHETISFCHNR